MPEYRPLSEDEMDDFDAFVQYAFSPSEGPWSPDEDDEDETTEEEKLGEAYGYFADVELVSICRHYPWQTWVRGERHPMAGLSAVATPPEHRRRGYVTEMLREALAEYREDGIYLSALWPFKHPFYERLGWGTTFTGYAHKCDPEDLAPFRGTHEGTWRRLNADDWERMNPVHDAHGAAFELTIEREEQWWRDRIFEGWKKDPYVYGLERDGELAAYVSFVVEDEADESQLRVRDVAWVDFEAREAIYGFLARHKSQVDRVHLWSIDDDLHWLVDDPGELDTELHSAAMFRLVDVASALESLPYPANIEAEFVLDVDDPLAEWNDGSFHVSIADGEAIVGTTVADDADASMRIDVLSQLYVGAQDVEFLTRTGQLETDAETAAVLDALFPETNVLLREGF